MDKAFRHELKYAINQPEYAGLRSQIRSLLRVDEHTGDQGEYHIRSVYFDDWKDSAFDEKEAGDFQRAKYRIRIYNKDERLIRLELKEKFASATAKTSRLITRDLYDRIMEQRLEFSMVRSDPFLTDFFLKVKTQGLAPKVIVDYIREPYIYPSGNVRITFDKHLQAGINTTDVFSPSILLASPLKYGSMILEVKYDDFIPLFIHQLLRLSSHQMMAISKYTLCRELKDALSWKDGPQ